MVVKITVMLTVDLNAVNPSINILFSILKNTLLYSVRCLSTAEAITRDSTHSAHHLFDPLPSGRCYRSIKTRTDRLRNSFFPQAITALNTSRH